MLKAAQEVAAVPTTPDQMVLPNQEVTAVPTTPDQMELPNEVFETAASDASTCAYRVGEAAAIGCCYVPLAITISAVEAGPPYSIVVVPTVGVLAFSLAFAGKVAGTVIGGVLGGFYGAGKGLFNNRSVADPQASADAVNFLNVEADEPKLQALFNSLLDDTGDSTPPKSEASKDLLSDLRNRRMVIIDKKAAMVSYLMNSENFGKATHERLVRLINRELGINYIYGHGTYKGL